MQIIFKRKISKEDLPASAQDLHVTSLHAQIHSSLFSVKHLSTCSSVFRLLFNTKFWHHFDWIIHLNFTSLYSFNWEDVGIWFLQFWTLFCHFSHSSVLSTLSSNQQIYLSFFYLSLKIGIIVSHLLLKIKHFGCWPCLFWNTVNSLIFSWSWFTEISIQSLSWGLK